MLNFSSQFAFCSAMSLDVEVKFILNRILNDSENAVVLQWHWKLCEIWGCVSDLLHLLLQVDLEMAENWLQKITLATWNISKTIDFNKCKFMNTCNYRERFCDIVFYFNQMASIWNACTRVKNEIHTKSNTSALLRIHENSNQSNAPKALQRDKWESCAGVYWKQFSHQISKLGGGVRLFSFGSGIICWICQRKMSWIMQS